NRNRICDAIPNGLIFLRGKDKNNRIWLEISQKLFVLDEKSLANGKLFPIAPSGNYSILKQYPFKNIAFNNDYLWLVYSNENLMSNEIWRIDDGGGLFKIALRESSAISGLRNILVDKENTIWLCNDGEGIIKIVNPRLLI